MTQVTPLASSTKSQFAGNRTLLQQNSSLTVVKGSSSTSTFRASEMRRVSEGGSLRELTFYQYRHSRLWVT